MSKDEILYDIEFCINNIDIIGLEDNLDLLFNEISDKEISVSLAQLLNKVYTSFKARGLAKIMEVIIKKRRNIALVNHPENPLFKLCVITGSFDLYECYIEEAVYPVLPIEKDDDAAPNMYYTDLQIVAEKLKEYFSDKRTKCIKGNAYNGAFSTLEGNDNVVLINKEDYEMMESAIEKYNTLLGRDDIISDLENKIFGD